MPVPWAARNPAYKARRAAYRKAADRTRKRSGKSKQREIEFIAVDGEGLTRDDNQHDYVLLAASDNTAVEAWQRDGLSTRQCFDYLLDVHKRNPNGTLIAFSFGYDVNMMLRDANRAEVERIASGEYTIVDRDYLVKHIPGKSFYVGRGHLENGGWKTDFGVTVWDTWGFYQSSFVAALEAWNICPTSTIEIIARMKEKRGEFGDEMQSLITSYCFRECDLLVQLMTEFRAVALAAGIKLTRWDGAGACASALLRSHEMKPHIKPEKPTPDAVERAALYSYFGGRIEVFGCGVIPTPCYEYDINSAYPAEIAALPSMAAGLWRRITNREGMPREDGLYRVRWEIPESSPLAPFPWREDDGRIIYPMCGEGWYHGVEVSAAIDVFGGGAFDIIDGYEYTPREYSRPFAWVETLYQLRRAYKEAGDAKAIVLKLALNAMYGKLAQSVGWSNRGEAPAYQSYYLAGRITAGTRARILRAAALAPDAMISTMTDALFSRVEIPQLTINHELGGWDVKTLAAGLLVVQPGVVLTPQSDCADCGGGGCHRCTRGQRMAFGRSRGFYRASLDYGAARGAWDAAGFIADFPIRERRFVGMGRALAQSRLIEWDIEHEPERDVFGNLISEQWRRWVEIEKLISFRANTKRKDTVGPYDDPLWQRFAPPDGTQKLGTIYHPKTVFRTLDDITQADATDQPDYAESIAVG